MYIYEHPILGKINKSPKVTIYINGRPHEGYLGEPVASALWAAGVRAYKLTKRFHEPRGPFCFIGRCTDCEVEIDGIPRVKACVTPVKEGMSIRVPDL